MVSAAQSVNADRKPCAVESTSPSQLHHIAILESGCPSERLETEVSVSADIEIVRLHPSMAGSDSGTPNSLPDLMRSAGMCTSSVLDRYLVLSGLEHLRPSGSKIQRKVGGPCSSSSRYCRIGPGISV